MLQPPVPFTVYVIVAAPAAIGVTIPVVVLIAATAVLLDDHMPPLIVDKSVVVPLEQILVSPLKVPAIGAAVMLTDLVAIALRQPLTEVVYVMVAAPADTGVITPLTALIVATAVLLDVQLPPVEVEVKVVLLVAPLVQILCIPLSVPASGPCVTVRLLVAVASAHAPDPDTVYVIIEVPGDKIVIVPVELFIVATKVLEEDHVPPKTVEENDIPVEFVQTDCVPLNVPAESN